MLQLAGECNRSDAEYHAGDVVIGAAMNATTINITDSDGGGIGLGNTAVGGFSCLELNFSC